MNNCIFIGRLTADPEISYSKADNPILIATYDIAVPRMIRGKNTELITDFFHCVCFGKGAEYARKHLHKGMKVCITGSFQNANYENKDGVTIYRDEFIVKEHEILEKKAPVKNEDPNSGFMEDQAEDIPY